jgi:hypothetical protein
MEEDEMSGARSTHGRDDKSYNMVVGKLARKKTLGRCKRT